MVLFAFILFCILVRSLNIERSVQNDPIEFEHLGEKGIKIYANYLTFTLISIYSYVEGGPSDTWEEAMFFFIIIPF